MVLRSQIETGDTQQWARPCGRGPRLRSFQDAKLQDHNEEDVKEARRRVGSGSDIRNAIGRRIRMPESWKLPVAGVQAQSVSVMPSHKFHAAFSENAWIADRRNGFGRPIQSPATRLLFSTAYNANDASAA